jgi:hypothetical protein
MSTVRVELLTSRHAGGNLGIPAWLMSEAGPQPVGGGFFRYPGVGRLCRPLTMPEFHFGLLTVHGAWCINVGLLLLLTTY